MGGDYLEFDTPGDELRDEEWPDDDEAGDDDGPSELAACPECGAEVYEDAQQCPACGSYITPMAHVPGAWSGRSWWWIALGAAGVVAMILWLLLSVGN